MAADFRLGICGSWPATELSQIQVLHRRYWPTAKASLGLVWRGGYNSKYGHSALFDQIFCGGCGIRGGLDCESAFSGRRKSFGANLSASSSGENSEMEASLFVQDPHFANGKKAVQVIWIPQPVQKYCLGKTDKECTTIDYCIRTTNKHAAMCQHLSVDTTHLPAYPPDVSPRRVLSIVYFFPMTSDKGFGRLAEFFENAPKGSLDHLSRNARIRARVKLTRSADDDQFEVLEVLEAPSRWLAIRGMSGEAGTAWLRDQWKRGSSAAWSE